MALINNYFVHVVEERVSSEVESTVHPVESGLDITDTVRSSPTEISLSGKIVRNGHIPASAVVNGLSALMGSGSLITYSGRNALHNMQIQSFSHGYTYNNAYGCDFEMVLRKVRIARPSYRAAKKTNSKTEAKTASTPKNTTVKVGDTVVFTGGNVYVSSTASSPAANRGKSTCNITKITANKHPYHLISKDGGKVYGWVDKANVKTVSTTSTASAASKSTKQVSAGNGKAVYHTVKKGNTIYSLVNKNYKSLGKSAQWVIDNNPKCFSKKGDPTTLIIGSKLLMGYKE